MPSGARPAADEDHVPGGGALGAQHKGTAHGTHYAVHKSVLPEDGLFHLGGKALKAAQMLGRHIGRSLCQQAVILHIPHKPPGVIQRRAGGRVLLFQAGILLLEQFIQLLLIFQQCGVQVCRGGSTRLCFRSGRAAAEARPPARAEHAVHKVFPIVGICHGFALRRIVFFQYRAGRCGLQGEGRLFPCGALPGQRPEEFPHQ